MRIQWMLIGCLVLTLAGCSEPPTWLEDRVDLLSDEQARSLNDYHRYLLEDHDIDYRMVIEAGDDDINQRAVTLFRSMKVGQRSDAGRGLLLLLNPAQNRVRVEVSQSLEGVYPDVMIHYLERQQMVPFFQRGRIADGILATTELMITRAQEAEQNQEYYASGSPSHAAGAGAVTDAELNAGAERQTEPGGPDVTAGHQPRDTVAAYLKAIAAHDDRPDLSLYTSDTQDMLAQ
ncbi:MAG: TPM domain-containing protein, partial [Marinobacter sp.]|nr:TPM domain-containing protein [Marinobacter sp.]